MKKNSRVSDVLHILLHMADQDAPVSSDFLARMMRTHPVVVRRTLSGLRERGLVTSSKGRAGGWALACDLAQVSLLDVYEAVGEPAIFAMGYRRASSGCLVEKAVNNALADSLAAAESLLMTRFGNVTLQSLYEDFSKDMAGVRARQAAEMPREAGL